MCNGWEAKKKMIQSKKKSVKVFLFNLFAIKDYKTPSSRVEGVITDGWKAASLWKEAGDNLKGAHKLPQNVDLRPESMVLFAKLWIIFVWPSATLSNSGKGWGRTGQLA